MPYKIDESDLVTYLFNRCQKRGYPLDNEILHDNRIGNPALYISKPARYTRDSIKLFVNVIKAEESGHDKIEFIVETDISGVQNDNFGKFLNSVVDNDLIFKKGQPFYSEEKYKSLGEWQKILKRVPDESKMICEISNRGISTKTLRKAIWEYMFKPCLFYFYNAGKDSLR